MEPNFMRAIPLTVVYLVIGSEAVLAFIGVTSLCATMFFKNYADPAILTAIISITSGLVGALAGLLVSARQPIPGTVTESSTTAPPPTPPPAPPDIPTEVKITNPPSEPIPTTEVPKP
jgi:hypothetical protein